MADYKEEKNKNTNTMNPTFPNDRIKKIMKLDKDINKINSKIMRMFTNAQVFMEALKEW